MADFSQYLERAGFQALFDSKSVIANQAYPVFLGLSSDRPQMQPLFCEAGAKTPRLSFLYFTLPGCENCRPGLESLQALAERNSRSAPMVEQMCLRIVVSDWPNQADILQEMREAGGLGRVGVVWDAEGVLQERLSVLGVPAGYFLDGEGRVFALNPGPVAFGSPGFEALESALYFMLQNEAKSTSKVLPLAQQLRQEIPLESSGIVMFLNHSKLSFVWLVAAIALCYSLSRLFLRLRKIFDGSQNSS